MTQTVASGGEEISGGRTVVVGVKLDAQSRELLTWALVKVAQAGDRVIAVHVLDNNEIMDRDGKSSLLSLVKAFDSILAVYEGFCNLKQVDLKLKICRGFPVRKTIVREAKSYLATEVILGTSQAHRTVRSNASVAKYCARKLPRDCAVLAISNGKIAYRRESTSISCVNPKEIEHHRRNRLLDALQRSWSKNIKAVNDGAQMLTWDETSCKELSLRPLRRSCSICSQESPRRDSSCGKSTSEPLDSDGDNGNNNGGRDRSMAIVPVHNPEASISLLMNKVQEHQPGWPLLRRGILPSGKSCYNFRKISVVQWAMQLPSRHRLPIEHSISSDSEGQMKNEVNGESLAIVPVGTENAYSITSPNRIARTLPRELERFHDKYSATCRLFKFDELASATSNFQPGNIIGKGGSSHVYKGSLPDGKEIAVKILKPSDDSLKEFVQEIEITTTLHHKNVMSLFGFCFEDNNLLLVYDFIPRGSLEDNLHGEKTDRMSFGWSERFKIAMGVAEALDYLHSREEDQPVIIHRDVKSSNILLLDDFEPQLSDFGLAKWASSTSAHITCSDVAGTFGYLAPEYFMYGKVNEKIDVYAFGVVLLELLSGRKPISNDLPKGQESLVMWAKPILNSHKFFKLLDTNLGSEYDREQVERLVLAASLCIRRAPRARPRMNLVLKLFRGDVEAIKWARLQVNASEGSEFLAQDANPLEGIDGLLLPEDEVCSQSNLQSHLNVALLGIDEDSSSISSIEQSVSLEDYLRGRWSRSSSFD